MPKISEFFGILITIQYLDHNPPHFHAKYGGNTIVVDIENGKVKGEMSERALRLILEWLDLHRSELLSEWEKASTGKIPNRIDPLP